MTVTRIDPATPATPATSTTSAPVTTRRRFVRLVRRPAAARRPAGPARAAAPTAARSPAAFFRAPKGSRKRLLTGLGWYEVAEAPMLTSTRQAEALNPALVSTHPPLAGPLLGLDVNTGQPATEDPHELYLARRVGSPNVVVLGAIDMGKSTLVKDQYAVRPVALGRQVCVFDRKDQQGSGEYGRVAQVAGGTVIRFDRRGGAVVNILDPRIATTSTSEQDGTVGQDLLLLMVAEFAHGPLSSRTRHALRAAHRAALRRARAQDRVATLGDVIASLYEPDEQAVPRPSLLAAGRVTVDDVAGWGLDLALDLDRFRCGDLSGLIDGPTRAEDGGELDLTAPLIVIDTSSLDEDSPALSLVMATMATYLSARWSTHPGQRLLVIEEGYHAARLPAVAAIFRQLAKRGRGIGLSVVTVFHHISDVPPDSDIMSLIREAGIVHVFRQDRTDDAAAVVDLFGLPRWVADELRMLDQGTHVLKIGKEPPVLVSHVRTPLEEWITDTRGGMQGRSTAEDAPFTDLRGGDDPDQDDITDPSETAGEAGAA